MAAVSWLLRSDTDRERMLDMDRRLQPIRRAALGILVIALLACGPWIGWWPVLPVLVAGGLFRIADEYMDRMARPEYGLFAAWAGAQVVIAISVALTGGPESPAIAWFAIPIVTLGARFSLRGIVAGVTVTIALMLAVSFGVDAAAVLDYPPLLLAPLALAAAIAVLSTALMHSDIQHRSEAVIDPLTGMLNRKALAARLEELAQQSTITSQPVAMIVGDIDSFKRINDTIGHTAGDAVLQEVAYTLRKELRAYDLAYRLGGEEFLILLPGSGEGQGLEMAERLRRAVSAGPVGPGCEVTMSFGVAASEPGARFAHDEVFRAADAALYEAKRGGRDRVSAPLAEPALAPA